MKQLFLPVAFLLSCASIHSMDYSGQFAFVFEKQQPKSSVAEVFYVPNEDGNNVLHTVIRNNNLSKKAEKEVGQLTDDLKEKAFRKTCYTDSDFCYTNSDFDESESHEELEAEATARCATLEKKYAALEENLSTTVCNLIACGADVNAQNKRGETPFHIALKQNPILTHTLLTKCKHVINPNIRDGRTKLLPLEYAMSDPEDPELTKNLLQCGADIKIILKPETDGESVASRFHSLSLPMKAVVTGYFAQLPKDQRDELCSSLMEKKNTAKKEDAAENKNDGNAAEAEEISPFVAQVVKGKTMDQTIKEKSDKLYRQSEDPEGAIQNKNPIIVGTQTGEGKRDNDKKSELFDKYDSDKYDSDED